MLIEALKKRKEGVELTPEEIELLKEFDSETKILSTTIERLKLEKSNAETQTALNSTTVEELTTALESFKTKVEDLTSQLEEKQAELSNVNQALEEATSISEAKEKKLKLDQQIETQKITKKIEKEKADEIAKAQKEKEDTLALIKSLEKQVEDMKAETEKAQSEKKFLETMVEMKSEKPYLTKHIDLLVAEVKAGTETFKTATKTITAIAKTMDHEEEMEKYKASLKPTSVVDKVKEDLLKEEEEKSKKGKVEKTDREDLLDFAKKCGII